MVKVVLSAGDTISNSAIRTSLFEIGGQSASRTLAECLFHDLRFRLVGCCLLIFQGLCGARIRRWRRNIRRFCTGVGSLRQATGSLLGSHLLHSVVELFLEVIVHLLQVV